MPLYENQNDRQQQSAVVDVMRDYFSAMPIVGANLKGEDNFELRETDQTKAMVQDVDIFQDGKYVGVAEIKCRAQEKYTMEYWKENGALITSKRLNDLMPFRKQGKHVMIVMRSYEGYVVFVMLQDLLDNRDKLQTVDGILTTDHGTKEKDGTATIIPMELLRVMGKCDSS